MIVRYLDRLFPDPPLYPSDPFESARAEWIEEYVDGGLVPIAGPGLFFPLVIRPLSGEEPDEAAAKKFIDEVLPPYFEYLDAQLGEREYFAGDALSIADITVASGLVNLRLAGVRPEPSRFANLDAFLKRMHAREIFRELIPPLVASIGKRWVELD